MATTRTVRQLIEGAFRLTGVFDAEDTPQAVDTSTALRVLQDLLAEKAGDFFVPYVIQEAITLVASQNSYTVGENGSPDLNTQRPENIVGAFIRDSSNYDYTVGVVSEARFRVIVSKTTTGTRPEVLWYNPTAPNGTVYTFPTPTSAESLYISSIKTLTEPTGLTQNLLDAVGIPRNYHNPLRWMLAMELCPEYGREPTPIIVARATTAENNLIALNVARSVKPVDIEVGSGYTAEPGRSILSY